ncbi:sensor histidine kinase [Sneathiella glossodoripedis]|uniref:sensor histidine kinase n=1 Tax=Sneathiella glossodoripedis TaxID=418853 RepID=UPI000470DFF9|nr:HAMP domain-containing sensor histidine kinase [Sneathiella glossodoripedis]
MKESVKRTRLQNRQLAKSTELANHANLVKSQFLAGMSHELRTPLNAIIGFSELISQEAFGPVEPPRYRQYAEDILESGKHLLAMISDILDMSKIEAGRYNLNEQLIDVGSVARNVIKICSVLAMKKDISLKLRLPANTSVIKADERAVKQMMLNLVSNGIKYTQAGGEVTLIISECAKHKLCICVKDTGIGIAEDQIEKITEPFMQVAQAHHNKSEGTGLGLAIVKALAKLHDCDFQIKSHVGQGTMASLIFSAERVGLSNHAA